MVALQVLRQLVVSQLLQAGVECRQGPVQQPPAQRDGILRVWFLRKWRILVRALADTA